MSTSYTSARPVFIELTDNEGNRRTYSLNEIKNFESSAFGGSDVTFAGWRGRQFVREGCDQIQALIVKATKVGFASEPNPAATPELDALNAYVADMDKKRAAASASSAAQAAEPGTLA
jgi:hypothetical protein